MRVTPSTDVLARIPKAPDLETHVRAVSVDGESFLELRDYVVSLAQYRRGYWVPADRNVVVALIEALLPLAEK